MSRLGLDKNGKFLRLAQGLNPVASGMGDVLAMGLLERLWGAAYERADDYLGDSDDVEIAAGWRGEPGALTKLLMVKPTGKTAGFIEEDKDRKGYVIHALWEHAPAWVKEKAKKAAAREAEGITISALRSAAGKKGRAAQLAAQQTESTLPATDGQTEKFCPAKSDDGTGRDGTGSKRLPPEKSGGGPQGVIPGLASNGLPDSPANGSPKRRGRPSSPTRSLPFTIADAMAAIGHAVLVEPFPKEPKFTANLTRLIRAYPDLSTWRRIADWLADGGDGWGDGKRGKPDLGIFIARFGGWMQASAQDGGGGLNHDSPPGDERPPWLDDPEELRAMLTNEEREKIDAHVARLKAHA